MAFKAITVCCFMLLAHDISVPVVPTERCETNNNGLSFPGGIGGHSLLWDITDGNSLPGARDRAMEEKFHNEQVS